MGCGPLDVWHRMVRVRQSSGDQLLCISQNQNRTSDQVSLTSVSHHSEAQRRVCRLQLLFRPSLAQVSMHTDFCKSSCTFRHVTARDMSTGNLNNLTVTNEAWQQVLGQCFFRSFFGLEFVTWLLYPRC